MRTARNQIEIFCIPIGFGGRLRVRHELPRAIIPAKFDFVLGESLCNAWQELVGDLLVDQQRLDGVADTGALALGIDDNLLCHLEVGVAIHVHMADAL